MTETIGSPNNDLLRPIAELVEAELPGALCSIHVLDPGADALRLAAAPGFPREAARVLDGIAIGPSASPSGRAAYHKTNVVTTNIEHESFPTEPKAEFAALGIRTVVAAPVLSQDNEALGTVSVYRQSEWQPNDGERRFIDSTAALIRAALEQSQTEQLLREQSRRDSLTNALNHAAITDLLAATLNTTEGPCAVAMVDVDAMKATNDTYGHQVGDQVLAVVAEALMRDGATVGRYGGDEFVVLVPGAGRPEAEQYQASVLEWLAAHPVHHPDSGLRVPVSLTTGFAIYPTEAEQFDDVIRLADSAMYASRRPESAQGPADTRLLDKERAAKLVSEIVPLLTRPGSREDKLRLVAHHLCVGAGYDAVNFEITGIDTVQPPAWQRAFARAPEGLVDAWMREQDQTQDHPLSKLLQETKQPVFLDNAREDARLLDAEREIIAAAGFKSGLAVPMIWHERLVGIVSVGSKQEAAFSSWDAQFLTAVASQVTAIVFMTKLVDDLKVASENQRRAHAEAVMMLAASAEAHDDTTGRHLQRVRAISEAIARQLGYHEAQATELGLASVLHDIGKIRVPEATLTSSTGLTDDQWRVMRQHTVWGAEFLSGRLGFELAEVIARAHHERWDGTGYPLGLAGADIPEVAAITSVADSFDAMTNDRPYRMGMPASEAIEEIIACSGKQFNPRVVDALVQLYQAGAIPSAGPNQNERQAA